MTRMGNAVKRKMGRMGRKREWARGEEEKVGCKSPVEALRELRKLKDKWKGVMELTNYCILHV